MMALEKALCFLGKGTIALGERAAAEDFDLHACSCPLTWGEPGLEEKWKISIRTNYIQINKNVYINIYFNIPFS